MKLYPETIESKIGFDTIRAVVSEKCLSTLGREKCQEMECMSQFDDAKRALDQTNEMCQILSSDEGFPLNSVHDLTPQLKTIRVPGTHIPESEMARLRNSLATIAEIAQFFATHRTDGRSPYPALDEIAQGISALPGVRAAIDRVIDKLGYVKDSASPELARLRGALASMQGTINAAMRRVVAKAIKDGYLDADASPSLRDGRPVIPVAAMNKRQIPGIVHDESATGKTFFIEPAEVVEASNRLRELQIEERREVMRILVELADQLRPHVPEMLEAYDILGQFDFIHAKARYAQEIEAQMPHLHRDMQLELYHACHPVLTSTLKHLDKEVVPLDVRLEPEKRILIISGPNAGGKSVTLKTVAIVQYMAQCGLLPPVYENSHISVVDTMFIDIGDDQSIENELSTYSSHLRNMKWLVANGSPRTLALIDEFGSGTEPQIGAAIAQALLSQFVEKGLWGVITTHYQNIKKFADETPGLINGSMLYDRQLMRPLFKLSIGAPGSSFAVEIARKIGLPEDIIRHAEEIVGSDYINIDRYLLDIARDKRYWETKRQQVRQKEKKIDALIEKYQEDADQLRSKRREIIDEARTQAKEILDKSNAAVERTIHEIKTANAERERTLAARRELEESKRELTADAEDNHPMLRQHKGKGSKRKSQDSKSQSPSPKALEIGSHVQLDGAGTVGEVLELNGANAVVAFGLLKTTVKASRLTPTSKKIDTGAKKAASYISADTSNDSRERQLRFKPEIDVRGMRVDEAVQAITYFIDDATQFNAQRVRILHGTGTGALRQYIRDYLSTVPSVAHYADEDVRFGGAGITVVELK